VNFIRKLASMKTADQLTAIYQLPTKLSNVRTGANNYIESYTCPQTAVLYSSNLTVLAPEIAELFVRRRRPLLIPPSPVRLHDKGLRIRDDSCP
jgi:hypothetical protein